MRQTSRYLSMNKREELNKIVKDSIAQSIFQLMKRKRFSDITITEIVKKAGVARASFYRNFAYKEDAVSYYIIDTMKLYKNQFYLADLRDNYYNLIVGTMDFIFDYKENLESLFNSGLSQLLLHAINTYLLESSIPPVTDKTEKYFLFSYGGSIFNIIYHWISDGTKESPEEIASIICK